MRNQLLLRLASIDLLDSEGEQVEFAIKRILSVNEPSRVTAGSHPQETPTGEVPNSAFPGAFELLQLQAELQSQSEDIKRIDNNGFKIVAALDKRVGRIDGEVTKLGGSVVDLRRDIGGVQKNFGTLKTEVSELRKFSQNDTGLAALEDRLSKLSRTVDKVSILSTEIGTEMPELKSELGQIRRDMEDLRSEVQNCATAADQAQDMAVLRAEISQLRRELDEVRNTRMSQVKTAFPPRELEILTTNIAKIGNRASQVETLQMEVEILKGRVERAENSRQMLDDQRRLHAVESSSLGYSDAFTGTRKRAVSPGFDRAPKKPNSSNGYADMAGQRYATPPSWPAALPAFTSRGRGDPPDNDNSVVAAAGKQGRSSGRGRKPTSSSGISTRLRKR